MSDQIQKVFLKGRRIFLRAFEREDLKGPYRQWINDPEVTSTLAAGTYPQSDDDLTAYFEQHQKSTDSILFAIVEIETGKHIGNARLHKIDWINRIAFRGIMIGDRSSWGKGYGVEVINLISAYGFGKLNLNKLKSYTLSGNVGIQKVNERTGYKPEGVGREEFYRDGKARDLIYWGLLRSEYEIMKHDHDRKPAEQSSEQVAAR